MAKGLDCGTGNFVAADKDGVRLQRNAFITLDSEKTSLKQLKLLKVPYIIINDKINVVGSKAYELANIFNSTELKRPMASGLLNPTEQNAFPVIKELVNKLVGSPSKENEKLTYCVPGTPIDSDRQVDYHEDVLKNMLSSLGYDVKSINEAVALAYAGLVDNELTGISISCLLPDQEIITERGLTPIKDIQIGDKVLTLRGKFEPVFQTIKKEHNGEIINFKYRGYNKSLKVTPEHKIFVKRDSNWVWIEAKDAKIGDVIQEPSIKTEGKLLHCSIKDKVTNSKNIIYKNIKVSKSFSRFIGYFLGDGTIYQDKTHNNITIDFGINEEEYVQDLKKLVKLFFNRNLQIFYDTKQERIRCIFSHKYLLDWLKNNCYSPTKEKIVPWNIEDLQYNVKIGLLEGLIRSDGYINNTTIGFTNTSKNLLLAVHLILGSLGVSNCFNFRMPRSRYYEKEQRCITGKKEGGEITVSGLDYNILLAILETDDTSQRLRSFSSHRESKITEIEKENYNGYVYDLSIEGNPSYCVPYLAVHNCGAGMCNIAIMYKGIAALTFSTSKSGDFINENVARDCGITPAKASYIKEKGNYTIDPESKQERTREQQAVKTYYEVLIRYLLSNIEHQFTSNTQMPTFPEPIPIVCGGGTSMVNGFIEVFREQFIQKGFPIEISEIKLVDEPLTAVARGCYIDADLDEEE